MKNLSTTSKLPGDHIIAGFTTHQTGPTQGYGNAEKINFARRKVLLTEQTKADLTEVAAGSLLFVGFASLIGLFLLIFTNTPCINAKYLPHPTASEIG